MAIQVYCRCKNCFPVHHKSCPKCGLSVKDNNRTKKYRVVVSWKGKRVVKHYANLTMAREGESAIRTDLHRGDFKFSNQSFPVLNDFFDRYLEYAQANKKT